MVCGSSLPSLVSSVPHNNGRDYSIQGRGCQLWIYKAQIACPIELLRQCYEKKTCSITHVTSDMYGTMIIISGSCVPFPYEAWANNLRL